MEMSVGAIERYNKDPGMKEIWDFKQKFESWKEVEMAIISARAKIGGIPKKTALEINRKTSRIFGPDLINETIQKILEREKTTHHDMKAFIDTITDEKWSGLSREEASFVHAGVTSYDIEDPALALNMVRSIDILTKNLETLSLFVYDLAYKHRNQEQIFRTHGVHAQPGTFGLKLLHWYSTLERQIENLNYLRKEVSIAKISGAVGTYAEIDPKTEEIALKKLGLKRAKVSTQIVSRDIHAAFVSRLAIIAGVLDKFATDIRYLQMTEILEVEEPFRKGQVGSSAMPHKRNPIRCESVCSLARLIRAFSAVAFDNQNTWQERDLANSANERFILPYSAILLNYMITVFTEVMAGLNVHPEKMEANLKKTRGLIASSQVMLALAQKGMAREEAHALVQKHALESWEKNKDFRTLLLEDPEITRWLSGEEVNRCLKSTKHLNRIDEIFSRFSC